MGTPHIFWNRPFPQWAEPLTRSLKLLDVCDRKQEDIPHDGRYEGMDLIGFVQRYVQTSHRHRPGMVRIFDAAAGLHKRWMPKSWQPSPRRFEVMLLEQALFEGAQAMLEGRRPNYRAIANFRHHFIDAEFEFSLRHDIVGRKQALPEGGWPSFWQTLLQHCRTDLFVSSDHCAFQ